MGIHRLRLIHTGFFDIQGYSLPTISFPNSRLTLRQPRQSSLRFVEVVFLGYLVDLVLPAIQRQALCNQLPLVPRQFHWQLCR